jgi:hypothetical protein
MMPLQNVTIASVETVDQVPVAAPDVAEEVSTLASFLLSELIPTS